jgi:hypothetical protein
METVIIKGLEVWPKDLGEMTWEEAKAEVAKLGPGWRLPTLEEFRETLSSMYYHIPNLHGDYYWSSMELNNYSAWTFNFLNGSTYFNKTTTFYVRAVRDFGADAAIEYLLKDF